MENLLKKFEIHSDDIRNNQEIGLIIMPQIERHLDDFYSWMSDHPEYKEYFAEDEARLNRVRRMQATYWSSFFDADLNETWHASRRHVGEVHANIDLPHDIYFAGVVFSANSIIRYINADGAINNKATKIESFNKILFLDSYVVIDKISQIQKEKINASAKELVEISTPVTPIYRGILLLPLLGFIDSLRAKEVMQRTLDAISKYRASVLLLDISGVSVMDTQVANQLIKIAKATKFMGCETVISGLSPEIAQTLVELGVETGNINTKASLEDSFQAALQKLNLQVTLDQDERR